MFDWILSHPESCILFLVALFCLWQSWKFGKDFFSPLNVYAFSQSLTLGIAYLKLNPAMTDFHLKTWFFWIGALAAFAVGALAIRFVWKMKELPLTRFEVRPLENYHWKLHFALSCILFLFYLVGIFGVVQVAGNLLLLTDNPSQWMTKHINYGYYALLFSSSPLLVLFFGIASFKNLNSVKSVRYLSRLMIVVTFVLNVLAYPNRGTIFFSIGILIILTNYLKRYIAPAWILSCLVFASVAFVSIGFLRNQYGSDSVEGMALKMAMDLPYKYVSNNYWNFDYAVNPPNDHEFHSHTYGIDFFNGVFDYFRLSGAFRNSYGWDGLFNESIEKVSGFNTASYLWEVYKDLYAPGVFIFPFLCALGLSFLHLNLYRGVSPRILMFYTLFIYFVGWWFFTPGYKQGIYWIWGFIIYLFTGICAIKKLPESNRAPDFRN